MMVMMLRLIRPGSNLTDLSSIPRLFSVGHVRPSLETVRLVRWSLCRAYLLDSTFD